MSVRCCIEKCLENLTTDQLQKARANFCNEYPTYELQRKMILNWFDNNQPREGEFTFTLSGKNVCRQAWLMTLGISRRRFYNLKSDYLQGRRSEKPGSYGVIPRSEETDKTIDYLETYFKEQCDYLPNTTHWHLSSSTKQTDVYQDITRAMISTGKSVCSYAPFRKVWKSNFPHVKVPKVKLP